MGRDPSASSGQALLAPSGGMDRAGVWPRLHAVLLARLRGAHALDFSRSAVYGSHIRALKGLEDGTKAC
jgi:hypothetical protein